MSCNNRGNDCGNCREHRRHHTGCMRMARGCWNTFPYYGGPCPDVCGCYGPRTWEEDDSDDCCEVRRCRKRRRRRRCRDGEPDVVLKAFAPLAVSPNGIVPLSKADFCRDSAFDVNCGLVTVESEGTYLATYTVQAPADTAMNTLFTLNVNDAAQSTATTQVVTEAGATTSSFTGQAIFQADEGDAVTLRSSEAVNVTESASQPMFTLSLVKLD